MSMLSGHCQIIIKALLLITWHSRTLATRSCKIRKLLQHEVELDMKMPQSCNKESNQPEFFNKQVSLMGQILLGHFNVYFLLSDATKRLPEDAPHSPPRVAKGRHGRPWSPRSMGSHQLKRANGQMANETFKDHSKMCVFFIYFLNH